MNLKKTVRFLHCVKTLLRLTTAILPLVFSMFLTGCASPAQPSAMIPTSFTVTKHHQGSVRVKVAGGNETNPLWVSDISCEDFSTALVAAMNRSALFQSVAENNTDYKLDVLLVKVMKPFAGFSMTVTIVSEWKLIRTHDSKVTADEFVTTDFTATVGDAFVAIKRVRLADEGAARANIAEGIRRLSELKLEN